MLARAMDIEAFVIGELASAPDYLPRRYGHDAGFSRY